MAVILVPAEFPGSHEHWEREGERCIAYVAELHS